MKNLIFKNYWVSIGIFLLIIIIYGSLANISHPQAHPPPYIDKVQHLSAYLILTFWFTQLLKSKKAIKVIISAILLGICLEFLQTFTDYRHFELLDILANTIGCLLGAALTNYLFPNFLTKIDQRLNS